MKCGKTFEEFEALNGISVEEILSVFEAVSQAYPMIVSANLTKNTYTERDYYDCLDRESARYMPSFIKRGVVTGTNGFPVM